MSKLRFPVGVSFWIVWLLSATCLSGIADEASTEVHFGIEGHYRVGAWTGIRYSGQQPVETLETRDGDGVEVRYQQAGPLGTDRWGYAIPGGEAVPLSLKSGDETIATFRFPISGSPSRGPAMIPPAMHWIVVLGDPLGVDKIGANELLNRDALIAVSRPSKSASLPDSVLGYDGVDMMMINADGIDLLRSLSVEQRTAIEQWITGGGHLFLTLGESSLELFEAAPWLQSLLSIDKPKTTTIDPSAVETFTSTQTPLTSFTGIRLPKEGGRILIMGKTSRRVSIPLAADYNIGFGRITAIAADLENEMFAAWPERLDLMTQLTGTILIPQKEDSTATNRDTAYNDLSGQLRATLDQFDIKRSFGFSMISLILMALIAAIGPLDYLLINRFLGRPLLGWLSFPVITIALSLVLAFEARPTSGNTTGKSSEPVANTVRCNRIEIVDIDTMAGVGRSFQASCIYSHDAALLNVNIEQSKTFSNLTESVQQALMSPFGYPGESFGGIQIAIEDARMPPYTIPLQLGTEPKNEIDNQSPSNTLTTSIVGVPLASRSSKCLATLLRFKPKLANHPGMQRRSGSELLQGELINPLPVDVLDGMLVYRNWAYLLPTRFPSGGRIARVNTLRQKNFRWRLSRQTALESSTETEEWDASSADFPDRVSEMLMFHNAVGGARYTGLQDEPLSCLDLSHMLSEDRCILIGRVANELTTLAITTEESPIIAEGESLTMIRIVLPVTSRSER